jgi:hypothetical protein
VPTATSALANIPVIGTIANGLLGGGTSSLLSGFGNLF